MKIIYQKPLFFVLKNAKYHLRWFTPANEVDLCGHATLAAAYVLFNKLGHPTKKICFSTRSGELAVEQKGGELIMDFPAIPSYPSEVTDTFSWLNECSLQPLEILTSKQDLMVVLSSESEVEMKINLAGHRGLILTARSNTEVVA